MSAVDTSPMPRRQTLSVTVKAVDNHLVAGAALMTVCGFVVEFVYFFTGDSSQFALYPIISLDHSQNLPTWYLSGLLALCALISSILLASCGDRPWQRLKWSGAVCVFGVLCLAAFTDLWGIVQHVWNLLFHSDGLDRMLLGYPVTTAFLIALLFAPFCLVVVSAILAALAWRHAERPIRLMTLVTAGALGGAFACHSWLMPMLERADGPAAADLLLPLLGVAKSSLCILGVSVLLAILARLVSARDLELRLAAGSET